MYCTSGIMGRAGKSPEWLRICPVTVGKLLYVLTVFFPVLFFLSLVRGVGIGIGIGIGIGGSGST
jgi:hypothetical protein